MRQMLLAFTLLLLAPPAHAAGPEVQGFEIVRFGIYTLDVTPGQRDAAGVRQSETKNERLALSTTTIPAKPGVIFGFEYKVVGQPDGASVIVRKVLHYPPPGARPPGSNQPVFVNATTLERVLNYTHFAGYQLTEPWELLPGKWVFEFWYGDRKLGAQEFTLVAQ